MSKKCRPLWREAHFEVKMYKPHQGFGPLLEFEMSKKCTPLWREAHFQIKQFKKNWGVRSTIGCSDVVSRGSRKGLGTLSKVSRNVRALSHFQKRWQAWGIWRGSAKMHFPWQAQYKRHVHQSCLEVRALIYWEGLHFGASDLQVCWDDFAWQVQHFVWPDITFSWQAQYFRTGGVEKSQNALVRGPLALHSTFHFSRKSRRIASFLMLSTSKNEEVSQNLRFRRCQVQKLRKPRRIAAFLMLSNSKTEEVSQNSFVFKLADRQIDRQPDRQRERER